MQQLQTPDEEASEQDQIKTTKKCLLNIGDHIEKCLNDYQRDEKELNMWRRLAKFPLLKIAPGVLRNSFCFKTSTCGGGYKTE